MTRRASQWLEEQSRSCDGVLLLWHARTRRSAASTARGDHEGRDASAGTSTCGSCSMASERLQCQAPPGWFTWRAGKSEEAARGKRPKHGGAPGRPPGQNRAGGGGRLRLKTTHTRPRSGLDGTNQCHACCGVLSKCALALLPPGPRVSGPSARSFCFSDARPALASRPQGADQGPDQVRSPSPACALRSSDARVQLSPGPPHGTQRCLCVAMPTGPLHRAFFL